MGKGENTGNQHFLLFLKCFQSIPKKNFFFNSTTQSRLLTTLRKKTFENFVGKRENAGNQHCLPLVTFFSTLPKANLNFLFTFKLSSANAFNLDRSEILSFGKELSYFYLIVVKCFQFGPG